VIQTGLRRRLPNVPPSASTEVERRGIPFDHAFRYELSGEAGNVINSTVTVSIESSFTAVSIGYGVVPKVQPIIFGIPPRPVGRGAQNLFSVGFGEVLRSLNVALTGTILKGQTGSEAVLKNGIRLNPDVAELALQGAGTAALGNEVFGRLFQVVGAPSELVQFKYAIFDEGSGREFQSEPILNIAGLGSAQGERPFRYFAKPITFRPRSTIRMEITEVSDFVGELHVALHGFKVLGEANTPTGVVQQRAARNRRR
jgi:hypothetical protein